MGSSTTVARPVIDADRELSNHFTSALGVKAQRYEPTTTGGESSLEEGIMAPERSRARRLHGIVEARLSAMGEGSHLLRLVYAHGTDALSDGADGTPAAGPPTGLIEGRNNAPDPLGLLRVAMTPSWGHGSLLRLAAGQGRALRAFGRRYPGATPAAHAVLDYLAYEAGRGKESTALLAKLREDCETSRDEALGRYVAVRATQHEQARTRRTAAEQAEIKEAERLLEKARVASSERRVPACLRMTDAQRERYRSAALEIVEAAERGPS